LILLWQPMCSVRQCHRHKTTLSPAASRSVKKGMSSSPRLRPNLASSCQFTIKQRPPPPAQTYLTCYYSKDEWSCLTYDERDRIRAARTRAGKRGGSRRATPNVPSPEFVAQVVSAINTSRILRLHLPLLNIISLPLLIPKMLVRHLAAAHLLNVARTNDCLWNRAPPRCHLQPNLLPRAAQIFRLFCHLLVALGLTC